MIKKLLFGKVIFFNNDIDATIALNAAERISIIEDFEDYLIDLHVKFWYNEAVV